MNELSDHFAQPGNEADNRDSKAHCTQPKSLKSQAHTQPTLGSKKAASYMLAAQVEWEFYVWEW
jgi:hypothetical protein